jgi:hypothetical protein
LQQQRIGKPKRTQSATMRNQSPENIPLKFQKGPLGSHRGSY